MLNKLVHIRNNFRVYNGWSFFYPCYKVIYNLSMLCKALSCSIPLSSRVLDFNLAYLLHNLNGTEMLFAIVMGGSVAPGWQSILPNYWFQKLPFGPFEIILKLISMI